jgi:hypothetical protein
MAAAPKSVAMGGNIIQTVNRMAVITPPTIAAFAVAVATFLTNSDLVILPSTYNKEFSKIENTNSIRTYANLGM